MLWQTTASSAGRVYTWKGSDGHCPALRLYEPQALRLLSARNARSEECM
jgi:hypothetical protein